MVERKKNESEKRENEKGNVNSALAPVAQTLDSAIHWITIQWISNWETNCTFHWIKIYPSDSAIHLLNNWGQLVFYKNNYCDTCHARFCRLLSSAVLSA